MPLRVSDPLLTTVLGLITKKYGENWAKMWIFTFLKTLLLKKMYLKARASRSSKNLVGQILCFNSQTQKLEGQPMVNLSKTDGAAAPAAPLNSPSLNANQFKGENSEEHPPYLSLRKIRSNYDQHPWIWHRKRILGRCVSI